jgi:hypothetical protein
MRSFLLLAGMLLVLAPPEDDEFKSENQAKSVRPGPRGSVAKEGAGDKGDKPAQPEKPREETKLYRADEVKELAAQDGKTVRVKGKVHSIYVPDSKKVCILNMGPDHRTCFKVTIFSSAWDKWPDGLAEIRKKYDKKTLTIEGRVRLYNNLPEIVANVPSQLVVSE